MFRKLQQAYKLIQFYCKALNSKGHGTHSPFVYTFIREVLNDDRHFYAYEEINHLKKDLSSDRTNILHNHKEITVSELTKKVLSDKYNRLLFRIVAYYNPKNILEIGTSIGLSTAYLASANKGIPVVSLEANQEIVSFAKQTFNDLSLDNVSIKITSPFLPDILTQEVSEHPFQMIFVNQAVENIFQFVSLSTMIESDAIVVFADINKDLEISKSWNTVRNQDTTTISIDLFSMGIVFFKKAQLKKQHFAIRF